MMHLLDLGQPHLDAARCREINRALSGPLASLRSEMKADVVYLVYREHGRANWDVVAHDCGHFPALLNGESIRIGGHLSPRVPQSIARLEMASNMRMLSFDLTSTLSIPWPHGNGHVWLIVGNFDRAGVVRTRACTRSQLALADAVRNAYDVGAQRASRKLFLHYRRSIGRLIEAERAFDRQGLLEAIALNARWFFNTSSAYVALPSSKPDKFVFAATEQIRTSGFRSLSLGADEGIGGLVRRKQRTVSTASYADDPRLKRGPFKETAQEGFKSAACTPLWQDGRVGGLIYIAQRAPRAFNDIELGLFEEFAELSAEAISADNSRRFREELLRRDERERLAETLHDRVVSSLLEMGMAAGTLASQAQEISSRQALEELQEKAQFCLDAVRACIAANSGADASAPASLRAIAAELRWAIGTRSQHLYQVIVDPAANDSQLLSVQTVHALRVIVGEALENARRHSNCRTVHVSLASEGGFIRLLVEDDGCGIGADRLPLLLDMPGHLGMRRMRSLAGQAGGTCQFGASAHGGLRVDVLLPSLPYHA